MRQINRHPTSGLRLMLVMLPFFLLLAAKLRAFLHRTGVAAVTDFSAFLILNGLLETTLRSFFVHLGATDLFTA